MNMLQSPKGLSERQLFVGEVFGKKEHTFSMICSTCIYIYTHSNIEIASVYDMWSS